MVVGAFDIPGLLPKEYTLTEKLPIQWSSKLTPSGSLAVLADNEGRPVFKRLDKEQFGVAYTTAADFNLCGFKPPTHSSVLADYYGGDSHLLENDLEFMVQQARQFNRDKAFCRSVCSRATWSED